MNSDEEFPVGKPVPRIDSFEVIGAAGPELTDEEKAWPVAAVQARNDSFETISESAPEGAEVVIRVRCDASASAAEVSAFVEKLRSAVAGVQADNRFPVQIIVPAPAG